MGEYTQTVAELEALSFDFGMESYPIFDETYRDALNSKILGHYKYHEICNEDTAIFKHYLNQELDEIMPLYNQLYVSAALSFNPLLTFSKTEDTTVATTQATEGENTGTQARTNTVATTGTTENATNNAQKVTGKDISSDTPQGLLAADDINGNVWATNARITDTGMTNTGTVMQEDNSDREETDNLSNTNTLVSETTGSATTGTTSSGYDRPLAELVKLHRETFLNIDVKVIRELKDCFFQVF
jgi:hypothetical protein